MLDLFLTVDRTPTLIEVVRQQTSIVEIVEEPQEEPIYEITWQDNPQGCDENTQWIAAEEPFYCINKPVRSARPQSTQNVRETVGNRSHSENWYTPGNCTWYAKSRRPDLPNNLGNANTWTVRARNQGIPTGTTPAVGAVGQYGMHVVYVTAVNSDGTFNLSEMNWRGLYVVSERHSVNPSGWNFIY